MISYVLYVFLYSVQGHAILLIENNPFPTPEACKMVRDSINERKVTKIGPYEFRVGSATCHSRNRRASVIEQATPPRKPVGGLNKEGVEYVKE